MVKADGWVGANPGEAMKINWQQIQQDSPAAYMEWVAWATYDKTDIPTHHLQFKSPETLKGWLERFFDAQGIWIEIGHWSQGVTAEVYLLDSPARLAVWNDVFNGFTRLEAFTAAIPEAFKILEGRL